MRTTVTLEPDVEQALKKAIENYPEGFKAFVNTLLRLGLAAYERGNSPRRISRIDFTEPVDLGDPLIGSIDDISETLTLGEGEDHR